MGRSAALGGDYAAEIHQIVRELSPLAMLAPAVGRCRCPAPVATSSPWPLSTGATRSAPTPTVR
ncbi:hypothetical protein ACFQ0T_14155 [Kitasatospora gansuensis]